MRLRHGDRGSSVRCQTYSSQDWGSTPESSDCSASSWGDANVGPVVGHRGKNLNETNSGFKADSEFKQNKMKSYQLEDDNIGMYDMDNLYDTPGKYLMML
jgi:hypothetical protein